MKYRIISIILVLLALGAAVVLTQDDKPQQKKTQSYNTGSSSVEFSK